MELLVLNLVSPCFIWLFTSKFFNLRYLQETPGYSTGSSFIYYIILGAFYMSGLAFYMTKIPESRNPGKHDIAVFI